MEWFVFITLVVFGAASGARFKPGAWYEGLRKPRWTPPNWAFPVVWTILYAFIAWAGVLTWNSEGLGLPLILWVAQWLFNTAWSWLFFGKRQMRLAFIDICLLWFSILGFILATLNTAPLASVLFVPYLLWVTTAAALNFSVWRLNPDEAEGSAATGA